MSDDEDLEWEEWMQMTDAQHDAILAREIAVYNRWFDALGPLGQYRHMRSSALRTIAESRARLQNPDWRYRCLDGISRDVIARARLRLLKLRAWRAMGVYPGQA
jgi:hypothetical protein